MIFSIINHKSMSTLNVVYLSILLSANMALCAQTSSDVRNGVLIYDSARCMNGINNVSGFMAVDMHGNIIKTRNAQLGISIDKHHYAGISAHEKFSYFKDDSIVWTIDGAPHHVFYLDEDTNLIGLGYQKESENSNIYYEVLHTIDREGQPVGAPKSFASLVNQLQKFFPENRDSIIKRNKEFVLKYIPSKHSYFDSFYFHINLVQIIPPNESEKKDSRFKHGNLLISDFINNFIAIIDRNDFNVLWVYFQPESALGQHGAQMLPDGRIIYLVNNIKVKNKEQYYSVVRILEPISKKIVWEYTGTPSYTLHSFTQGFCQYLNNGNVLITINNVATEGEGYVIEVTPSKEIVWKWVPINYKQIANLDEGFTFVKRGEGF